MMVSNLEDLISNGINYIVHMNWCIKKKSISRAPNIEKKMKNHIEYLI